MPLWGEFGAPPEGLATGCEGTLTTTGMVWAKSCSQPRIQPGFSRQ